MIDDCRLLIEKHAHTNIKPVNLKKILDTQCWILDVKWILSLILVTLDTLSHFTSEGGKNVTYK